MLVRFKENNPVKTSQVGGFQGRFSVIASKGLITSQMVEILQHIFKQISREPQFARTGSASDTAGDEPSPPQPVDHTGNEMSRVLRITDEAGPKSLHHRLLLALLVYSFNFHNQPQILPPAKAASSSSKHTRIRHPYLEILSKVALELCQPSKPGDPNAVTEREVTLWTMVAIASASSFSPWRLDIPFMGHLIEWMENDEDEEPQTTKRRQTYESNYQSGEIPSGDASATSEPPKKPVKNLEKLTACLRGYYLYGADKQTLRSLQNWKDSEPQNPA